MSEVKRYYSFFTSHPGDWRPCSKERHDMVRANPQDWPGYEVRELAVIPEGHVVVPRELLEELLEAAKDGAAHKGEYLSKKYGEPELFAKFDTLLQS
ncbi:TPA: hypothetical protein L4734_006726 [Pseudomonas aeruginosa]|uniref:hypothetical protein n=1 Tax=Pseudomonas aeruginosa TaxID=287 RepID=UPI0021F20917|nr:hypothetical protein [Pseudomonas aeruginosa]MCV4082551.1 hypothetical protein [Pseudomonas aeruginosa]HBO6231837.1 hypothetical protein [Pseudomonas aeruginosa]HDQ3328985.1 hypothetical protein [Pseudomonas aeruginosa]